MDQQATCGTGLAENAALPGKLAQLTAALAEVLEVHVKALDLTDESSRKERDAYLELARDHQDVATRLQAIADRMEGYRNLPMGRHDHGAMASPIARGSFAEFVGLEQELLAMLERRLVQDRQMLGIMSGAGPASP
jgi:hypothetical protein